MQFGSGPRVFEPLEDSTDERSATGGRTAANERNGHRDDDFSHLFIDDLDVLDASRLGGGLTGERYFQREVMSDSGERRIAGESVGWGLGELAVLLRVDAETNFAG